MVLVLLNHMSQYIQMKRIADLFRGKDWSNYILDGFQKHNPSLRHIAVYQLNFLDSDISSTVRSYMTLLCNRSVRWLRLWITLLFNICEIILTIFKLRLKSSNCDAKTLFVYAVIHLFIRIVSVFSKES